MHFRSPPLNLQTHSHPHLHRTNINSKPLNPTNLNTKSNRNNIAKPRFTRVAVIEMILTQKIRTLRPVEDQIERDQLKTSAKSRSGAIAVGLASVGFRLTELVLEIGLTNSNVEPLGGEQWSLFVLQTGTIRLRPISFRKDWHHLHLASKAQTQMEASTSSPIETPTWRWKEIERHGPRKESSWGGLEVSSKCKETHITDTHITHKREQPHSDLMKFRFYPPTILGFVLQVQTWFTPKASSSAAEQRQKATGKRTAKWIDKLKGENRRRVEIRVDRRSRSGGGSGMGGRGWEESLFPD